MPDTLIHMGRKKNAIRTTSVRVSEHIARMIEVISTADDMSSAEICDPILEPAIRKKYDAAVKKINDESRTMRSSADKN